MILKVKPALLLKGKVRLPASKSYSIRAWMIAACGGTSVLIHPSDCDDAKVAMDAARGLGASVRGLGNGRYAVRADGIKIAGAKINVRESGTVLRFVLPLLSGADHGIVVEGEGTLRGRPNHHLLRALRSCGMKIRGSGAKESVPIRFTGGQLNPGKIVIDGSLSSQFISSLLISCPRLLKPSEVWLSGATLVSSDYIEMTTAILKRSGVRVRKVSRRCYRIPGPQSFRGLKNFAIPSDYGLAAFLMAAAALVPSDVTLEGHFADSLIQADGRILSFLKAMGVRWQKTRNAIKMKGPFQLKGGVFSLKDCPDLVPIMAVLGLFAKGGVRLIDIAHARAKESDRISDLRCELLKMGARIEESAGSLTVYPLATFAKNSVLDPHRDHRLAMAFTVLGLRTGLCVKDIDCVSKSYPGFVRDMKALRAPLAKATIN